MQKTPEMERIELKDAVARKGAVRDIREVITEAFDTAGDLDGAAAILGVHRSTLSAWINENLEGKLKSRPVFEGFKASGTPAREVTLCAP